jgi:hypothetical protein
MPKKAMAHRMAIPSGPVCPATVKPSQTMASAESTEPISSTTICSVTFFGVTGRSVEASVPDEDVFGGVLPTLVEAGEGAWG